MGVGVDPLTEEERADVGIGQEIGLRVGSVAEGGPAHRAGILEGDIILALHHTKVGSVEGVLKILEGFRPGEEIRVIFLRHGKLWDGSVILGKKSPPPGEKGEAPREKSPAPQPRPGLPQEEDIGPKVREILGEEHYQALSKLARDFGYKGAFTRKGLNEFFGRIGFDEKAMRENLKRMGVENKKIDKLMELLEGNKSDREEAKKAKGRWAGVFSRGRVAGTLELQLKGVDRLGNLKGKLTVEYGRVKLTSSISGRLSSSGLKIAFRTNGVGGYWTFEGEKGRKSGVIEGKFTTVGSLGAVRGKEGVFRLERK